tara:strand:- start:1210 stop:2499 length:1290 start_codon:yes stop_codon:yes gene_type:complete
MSKILGVDTSTIDNISGLGTGSGSEGIPEFVSNTDTGIVVCPQGSAIGKPNSTAALSDYENSMHMFQISDITGVVFMLYNQVHHGALKSNGDFFVGGFGTSTGMGLSSSDATSVINDGGMKLSLSNVAKVSATTNGFIAIKTDGTLWFSGYIGSYLNSTGVGGGSVSSNFGWAQIGSDTDWHDISASYSYPYFVNAIKGAAGSRYLYASGTGANYATGQGSTSTLTSFTRVKSSSGTNLSESMSLLSLIGYSNSLAISDSGKLFAWGENGYGTGGQGNTTDIQYATQAGSATNWNGCWVTRFGAFAKNTSGEMYMTTGRSSWRIEPNTNKVFTKIDNDTDYEDLRVYSNSQQSGYYTAFAKKGGSWFVSTSGVPTNGWAGNGAQTSSTTGWVALNTVLQKNDITGDIDDILPYFSTSTGGNPCVMFALS